MKRTKQVEAINAMKTRNHVLVIALGRNGGPMRDRRQRRAKERDRRDLAARFSE
jgi:hypothetical protein